MMCKGVIAVALLLGIACNGQFVPGQQLNAHEQVRLVSDNFSFHREYHISDCVVEFDVFCSECWLYSWYFVCVGDCWSRVGGVAGCA